MESQYTTMRLIGRIILSFVCSVWENSQGVCRSDYFTPTEKKKKKKWRSCSKEHWCLRLMVWFGLPNQMNFPASCSFYKVTLHVSSDVASIQMLTTFRQLGLSAMNEMRGERISLSRWLRSRKAVWKLPRSSEKAWNAWNVFNLGAQTKPRALGKKLTVRTTPYCLPNRMLPQPHKCTRKHLLWTKLAVRNIWHWPSKADLNGGRGSQGRVVWTFHWDWRYSAIHHIVNGMTTIKIKMSMRSISSLQLLRSDAMRKQSFWNAMGECNVDLISVKLITGSPSLLFL